MHNPVAQMVLQGPTIRQHKREKKALVRCIEKRAANSDKLIRELCEEIDRLKSKLSSERRRHERELAAIVRKYEKRLRSK